MSVENVGDLQRREKSVYHGRARNVRVFSPTKLDWTSRKDDDSQSRGLTTVFNSVSVSLTVQSSILNGHVGAVIKGTCLR